MVSCGKYVFQVQSSTSQDNVPDPAELDLESGQDELKVEALLLPFSIVVPPMYHFQSTCYLEEHVHSKSLSILLWAKTRLDVGEVKYMQKTERIHFFP